jgi:hypothetical protein
MRGIESLLQAWIHNKLLLREINAIAESCVEAEQFINIVREEMGLRNLDDNYSIVCAFVH